MELLIMYLKILIGFIFIMFIVSMIINCMSWKYYKSKYNTLNKDDYTYDGKGDLLIGRDIYDVTWNIYNDNFIWKSNNGNYIVLLNSVVTRFDPYTYYWWIKYKNWFKLNFPNIK